MAERNKNTGVKRRQYFIKKGFQARFMALFVIILILGAVVTVGVTLMTNNGSLTSTYVDSKLVIQNTSLAILPSVVYTTVLTTFFIGVVAVLVTLLVSHKIAGPIYRFEKDIRLVAQGDLTTRINIRKDDQFQELAVSLNTMIESLAARISDVKKEADTVAGSPDIAERVSKKIDDNFKC